MLESTAVRLSVFLIVLLLMISIEALLPYKRRTQTRSRRWVTNLGLVFLNSLALKLLGPITAVGVAAYALDNGWGLLALVPLPLYLDIIIGVILLDFAIYVQHVLSHKLPLLWKLHRVHHCDRDIDATTGIRFHPIEILFSMIYKCLIVVILGPLPLAVIAFEVILNASAMFNHSNIKLPLAVERIVRLLFVTPSMHRVHHSIFPHETDSNYGFCLSVWDRLCRTYIKDAQGGQDNMTIGLSEYQNDSPSSIVWCLKLPFKNNPN